MLLKPSGNIQFPVQMIVKPWSHNSVIKSIRLVVCKSQNIAKFISNKLQFQIFPLNVYSSLAINSAIQRFKSSSVKLIIHCSGQCGSVATLSHKPKGGRLIPSWGAFVSWGLGPPVGAQMKGNRWMFLSHLDISLSLSLPSPLSKINEHILG